LDAIPESETITAWCADLTEDLTGDVGLIEVPGESVAFNIQPGYEDNAEYDPARDGQLTPTMAMSSAAAFYNLAMLPGWQKWKPTFRYGTITAISGDTADVSLESATSTQQSLGVNQAASLNDVPVQYMNCHGAAFEVGDDVLVKFNGQDWSSPVVVGFRDHPRACALYIWAQVDALFVIWDMSANQPMDTETIESAPSISWPADITGVAGSAFEDWFKSQYSILPSFVDSEYMGTVSPSGSGSSYSRPIITCHIPEISSYRNDPPEYEPYSRETMHYSWDRQVTVTTAGDGISTGDLTQDLSSLFLGSAWFFSFRDEKWAVYEKKTEFSDGEKHAEWKFSGPAITCYECSMTYDDERATTVKCSLPVSQETILNGSVSFSNSACGESYTRDDSGVFLCQNGTEEAIWSDSFYDTSFGLFAVLLGTTLEPFTYFSQTIEDIKCRIYSGSWEGGGTAEDGKPENLSVSGFARDMGDLEDYIEGQLKPPGLIDRISNFILKGYK